MILLCGEQRKGHDIQLNEMHKALSQAVWTACTIFISHECKSQIQKGSASGYLCVFRARVFIRFDIVCALSALIGSCSNMSSWNKIDYHHHHHHQNKKDFPIKNLCRVQVEAWTYANTRRPGGPAGGFVPVHAGVRTWTPMNAHRYTAVWIADSCLSGCLGDCC